MISHTIKTFSISVLFAAAAISQAAAQTPALNLPGSSPAPAAAPAASAAASGHAAAHSGQVSFALVDFEGVIAESQARKGLVDQVQKQRQITLAQQDKYENELHQAQKDMERSNLVGDALAQKQKQVEATRDGYAKDLETRQRDLKGSYEVAISSLEKTLVGIIKQMSQEKNVSLVLVGNTVVVNNLPELDISKEALDRLNKAMPSVTLKPASASTTAGTGK